MKKKTVPPARGKPAGGAKPRFDKPRINSLRGESPFVIKPFLQFAPECSNDGTPSIELVWIAHLKRSLWQVEYRTVGASEWISAKVEKVDSVVIKDNEFRRFRSLLNNLTPGCKFEYRVLISENQFFVATAKVPPAKGARTRVVLFGDFADGDLEATKIAKGAYNADGDFVVLAGDVVYNNGLFSEYRRHFDPVFNGEGDKGAPVGRSVVTAVIPGNHDVRVPDRFDFTQHVSEEDLFAYFRIFRAPDNGPWLRSGVVSNMVQKERSGKLLSKLFGEDFIRRSNFYFRQGDSFWLFLDANEYMDWRSEDLQKWLRKALKKGADCTWKFICFHQPGFNSDAKYKHDTRMRVLSPLFEEFGVDIVFSGHCHFYERSFPLKFKLKLGKPGKKLLPEGQMALDKQFDGVTNKKPKGVIYIVSGAGGLLVSHDMRPTAHGLNESCYKLEDRKNSFSVIDIDGKSLTLTQIDTEGGELDRFTIEKD